MKFDFWISYDLYICFCVDLAVLFDCQSNRTSIQTSNFTRTESNAYITDTLYKLYTHNSSRSNKVLCAKGLLWKRKDHFRPQAQFQNVLIFRFCQTFWVEAGNIAWYFRLFALIKNIAVSSRLKSIFAIKRFSFQVLPLAQGNEA